MHDFVKWLVDFVEHLGYFGIFIMTLIESTFVPIPSEVTMIPAGYLVQQGKMNFWWVFLSSVTGTVIGAYVNYWIAKHYGRRLFTKYGKYFMMTPQKLRKLEKFYSQHGSLSTFIGRLLPGIRHYISFPAGLAKMNVAKFFIYTSLGGAIWMAVLLIVGYKIGDNEDMVRQILPVIQVVIYGLIACFVGLYFARRRRLKKTGIKPKDLTEKVIDISNGD
jgi:membrane protein DedA with SNARE-associated domain